MLTAIAEKEICEHGATLCYLCGVGGPKISQEKLDEMFKRQKSPRPQNLEIVEYENQVSKKFGSKQKSKSPCMHSSAEVASLSCGCNGVRSLFECSKHPDKIIIRQPLSKPSGRIIGTGQIITMKDCFACSSCEEYEPSIKGKENG